MDLSPLELYETAYNLHYIDKKISSAVLAYEKLIKEFPESIECGYAVIQLRKIRSASLSDEIRRSETSQNPFALIAFVFALLAILACGATVWYFKKLLDKEKVRTTLTTDAIGKVLRGDDDDALRVLAELKNVDKGNVAAFELTADIYRKRDDLEEKKSKQQNFSSQIDEKNENAIFNEFLSEDLKDNDSVKENTVPVSVQKKKLQMTDSLEKTTAGGQNMPVKTGNQPKAPIKGLFVVDPDSLSYF
jgi:cell division protein FtsN